LRSRLGAGDDAPADREFERALGAAKKALAEEEYDAFSLALRRALRRKPQEPRALDLRTQMEARLKPVSERAQSLLSSLTAAAQENPVLRTDADAVKRLLTRGTSRSRVKDYGGAMSDLTAAVTKAEAALEGAAGEGAAE
jgi:hypothetical protein